MKNPRLTPKDRGLIKGAIRRAFARSELHQKIVDRTKIQHFDPNRARVKKWAVCELCKQKVPQYTVVVDHVVPIIPLDQEFSEMDLNEVIDRTWCDEANLQGICNPCHEVKTLREDNIRAQHKFWKQVENVGECQIWRGKQKTSIYNKVKYLITRLPHFWSTGEVINKKIKPSCGNPLCVRPSHVANLNT